uniref:Uncharacterized protein n=1 Tax=Mycena chlorophos TaxID=658473 RepID=A0ABQ0M1Q2_MYCCL|nr:predicted protein [Mycena chlorophos]
MPPLRPEPVLPPPAFLRLLDDVEPQSASLEIEFGSSFESSVGELLESIATTSQGAMPVDPVDDEPVKPRVFVFDWPPPPAHDPPAHVVAAWQERQRCLAQSQPHSPLSPQLSPIEDARPSLSTTHSQSETTLAIRGSDKPKKGWKSLRRAVSGIFQRSRSPLRPGLSRSSSQTDETLAVSSSGEEHSTRGQSPKRHRTLSTRSTRSTCSRKHSQRRPEPPPVPALPLSVPASPSSLKWPTSCRSMDSVARPREVVSDGA